MNSVVIDTIQCDSIVKLLEGITLPPDKEEPMRINLPKDVLKNFYFTIVAISHQTTPIKGPVLQGIVDGKHLKGWDYLRMKWLIATREDNSLVYPQKLSSISSEDIVNILQDDTGNSTVYNPKGRALLLNDLGKRMLDLNYNSVQDLYCKSQGFLHNKNGCGLLDLLSEFKAYADPVKKKSLFFLTLMKNHSLWTYKDESNLGPPVDYHEVRGHLRYGSVRIMDEYLLEKISRNLVVTQEEDIKIREAVYKAIMYISERSRRTPSTLHYFFWNLFRNCCNRENPHCKECPPHCKLPYRYAKLKRQLSVKGCVLAKQCRSAKSKDKLIEHKIDTEYY